MNRKNEYLGVWMQNKITKRWYEISYLDKKKKVIENFTYRTMSDERKEKEFNKHLRKAKKNGSVSRVVLFFCKKDNLGRKFSEIIKSITLRNFSTYTDSYTIEFFKGKI